MLRLTREAVAAFTDDAYRQFARELRSWWSIRLPWFVEFLGEDHETLGSHVIDEAASYGYRTQAEIMRYSIGYVFFGSRFPESPLHENLLARCHWWDPVAPILKLARILDHVDMLTWNGTFSVRHGCLESIPIVTSCPLLPLTPDHLAGALRPVAARRFAHLNLDQLGNYVHLMDPRLRATSVPATWRLRAAMLGVFLGWNWIESPAWAWVLDAIRRDDTDTITRRLHGSAGT